MRRIVIVVVLVIGCVMNSTAHVKDSTINYKVIVKLKDKSVLRGELVSEEIVNTTFQ